MADSARTTRFRFWRWLIAMIGVTVPRRFRLRWRQEWEAELEYREAMLARWDRLDPNLPVFNVKTFAEQINDSVSRERLVAMLSSFFGFFALLLASLGLYGEMAYAVTRRTREIGIRMALGAQRASVLRMMLRETLLLALIGITIGLPAALAATRLTEGLLFNLSATDPLTITLATLVLMLIAVLAVYLPARRAARVDPMVALRHD